MDMTVSVIIPTYRRPRYLEHCLSALAEQHRPADEVLVVIRKDDEESGTVVGQAPDARSVVVDEPGVLAAMAAGVRAATGHILIFVDDDVRARPRWLECLIPHFADAGVGAVGGRDVILRPAQAGPSTTDVGRVTRWGRVIGNHHLGEGPPRDVEVLKGANMAFRRSALALPIGLRGEGAQVNYEVPTCIWAAERGWRLVYDPGALVDHDAGPRFDADQRDDPSPSAIRDASFNLVAGLIATRPRLLWRRAAYGLLIGDGATPGLARALAGVVERDRSVLRALGPSLAGQASALALHLLGRGIRMQAFAHADH
jgi:glycosyltransferase involved in cell wall biosynthesis